jgi:hypothetical protein
LAPDVSLRGALQRRLAFQERGREAGHHVVAGGGLATTAKELSNEIRSYLLKASDLKLIRQSPDDVRRLLVFTKAKGESGARFDIAVGSVRNFRRDPKLPHFSRGDGWWFDFQLLVEEVGERPQIIAYDFELRAPAEPKSPPPFPFVRFDLNPPAHANDDDGLRAHMHLGNDDDGYSIPSAIMSPFEILDLFLHGLRRTGRNRRAAPVGGTSILRLQTQGHAPSGSRAWLQTHDGEGCATAEARSGLPRHPMAARRRRLGRRA